MIFIRGTPCLENQAAQHSNQDEDGDSIISASSEDLDLSGLEEDVEGEELLPENDSDLKNLFRSETSASSFIFPPPTPNLL